MPQPSIWFYHISSQVLSVSVPSWLNRTGLGARCQTRLVAEARSVATPTTPLPYPIPRLLVRAPPTRAARPSPPPNLAVIWLPSADRSTPKYNIHRSAPDVRRPAYMARLQTSLGLVITWRLPPAELRGLLGTGTASLRRPSCSEKIGRTDSGTLRHRDIFVTDGFAQRSVHSSPFQPMKG